jgi:leucyl-tRNA synthetase
VAFAPWPVPDAARCDPKAEGAEELLSRTIEDTESILKLIHLVPGSITILVAPDWKRSVFAAVAGSRDSGLALKELMADPAMRKHGKETVDAVKQCTALVHKLPEDLVRLSAEGKIDEFLLYSSSRDFIEKEFGVPVRIIEASESSHAKAKLALPLKPAIIIE